MKHRYIRIDILYLWLLDTRERLKNGKCEALYSMGKINLCNDLIDELAKRKPFETKRRLLE